MPVSIGQITTVGQKLRMFRALRHRNFRLLWLSATGQSMAMGMQFLILGWMILEETGSRSGLGLVIFLYGMPNLALMVFGGVFADRINRLKLLFTCQAIVTVLILALAVLTQANLVAVWHIYTTAFILGTIQAMNMPARMAMVADMVDRENLMNAVSLTMLVMNTGRIIGPAIAGVLIDVAGLGPALFFNVGCYFAGTMCLLLIRGVTLQKREARSGAILGDLATGLRYFWATPVAFSVIGIGFAFGFFGMPHMQVMPGFAKDVLGADASGAGLLIMAAGLGSLLGSLILASLGNTPYKNRLLLGTITMFCISLVLFAFSPWYWVSWAILIFVGMGSMSYVAVGTTVLQLTVPSEVQGRVLSLWMMGASFMYVGALPTALVADALDWRIAVAAGAVISLAFAVWLGMLRPTIRHLRV